MIIDVRQDDAWLCFSATLEDGDTPVKSPGSLAATDSRVELAPSTAVHPDLVALAAILIFEPWSSRFRLNFGVSELFSSVAQERAGVIVGPVDPTVRPRSRPDSSVPGLCYSGGADCTAALTVMPPETRSYFLDRIARPGDSWRGLYNKAAAYHSCESLAETGRAIDVVQSDLEFVRRPVGFPHDFSNAIPAVLRADRDQLGAIAWGAILESTYRVGSLKFRDYAQSPWFVGVGPLFEAVGLPVYNPVAGVSEVGTAIITGMSPYGAFAQSCMRGDVGRPCRRCWKCARKILLDAALAGEWPSPAEIDAMVAGADTWKMFLKEPLKHEVVVAFFAARYPVDGGSVFMNLLKDRVSGYDTSWLERWYKPSLDLSPHDLQAWTSDELNRFLKPMTPEHERAVRGWDIAPLLETNRRKVATARFEEHLNEIVRISRHSRERPRKEVPSRAAGAPGSVELSGHSDARPWISVLIAVVKRKAARIPILRRAYADLKAALRRRSS